MQQFHLAYEEMMPFSISFLLYSRRGEGAATTHRAFWLRNLQGQSAEERQAEALLIMDEVAEELHYLTGYGVDRGTLKLGGRKVEQHVYPEFVPQSPQSQFRDGVMLVLKSPYTYYWVKGTERHIALPTDSSTEGWEITVWSDTRPVSFRLPARITRGMTPSPGTLSSFFHRQGNWITFDKADPTWLRFLKRLEMDGCLALGDQRVFRGPDTYLGIQEMDWPAPKRKKSKAPRRTALASYPSDNTEYVYMIRMGRTSMYKIGISNNPGSRVAALQTANPHKLQLLHTFRADNATAAEEALHHALHHTRQQGEWFRLTTEQRARLVAVQRFEKGFFWLETGPVTGDELVGEG